MSTKLFILIYRRGYQGSVLLDRKETIAILKKLVAEDLVEPSYVSMQERKPHHYQIQIKSNYKKTRVQEFAKNNSLAIEEDKGKKYLIIYKP